MTGGLNMTKQLLIFTMSALGLYAQSSHFQPPGLTTPTHGQTDSVFTSGWPPDGQSGPFIGRPFSGTEVRRTIQILGDGTHVEHSDTSLFFRDAQGRMRNESADRVQIYDPVQNSSYTLELKKKVYEKTPRPVADGTSYSMAVVGGLIVSGTNGPPKPGHGEELPSQMVNGVYCRGSRVTTTIPAGTFGNDRDVKVVNERWYSDDLKALVKSTNSDPRFGTSTYELTNIVMAHPDASLFMVPMDFTNVQSHGGN
jgi:hypothetical protein